MAKIKVRLDENIPPNEGCYVLEWFIYKDCGIVSLGSHKNEEDT